MEPAGDGSRWWDERRRRRLAHLFTVVSALAIAAYPLLPPTAQVADLALVYVWSAFCVGVGRQALAPHARVTWTLLLIGQVVLAAANVGQAGERGVVILLGWLLGTVGNLLVFAAAMSLVVRRGAADLGGLIDAAIIGFAVGSVLWAVLPHTWTGDSAWAQQLHRFVVVFALPAMLGPVVRFLRGPAQTPPGLWWLLVALTGALAGHIVLAADSERLLNQTVSAMLFMLAFVALGRFALSPSSATLANAQAVPRPEHLSVGRLLLLAFAVNAIPTLGGLREAFGSRAGGLVLVMQGVILTALVMARIGLLAAERQRAEQALAHLANHDPLTQLPNRHLLIDRLRDTLAGGGECALLFCDLDDFKMINDELGHDAGDRVLIEVARRLRQCIRQPDLACRLGGDEFVILLVDATPTQAQAVRDRIEAELSEPTDMGVPIRVSVGVVPADGIRDPEQLLKAADAAMYEVKVAHGRGRSRPGG